MDTMLRHFRWVFLGAVTSGTFAIFLLGELHGAALFVALGIMVLFGLVVWNKVRSELASEGDADTFYYLGFLFTLATLVRAFWPYMPFFLSGNPGVTEAQVLGLFGLGLFTTFFGLAGRIVLSRMGVSDDAEISGSFALLANRFGELSDEVRKTADDFVQQRERLTHEMEQISGVAMMAAKGYGKKVDESLTDLFKLLRASVEKSAQDTVASTGALLNDLKDSRGLVQETTDGIRDNSQRLRRAVNALSDHVEKTVNAMGVVASGLNGVAAMNEPLHALSGEARENIKIVQKYREDLAAALEASSASIVEVHARLLHCSVILLKAVGGSTPS